MYNFHCYEPVVFTHQGAGWISGMPLDFRLPLSVPYRRLAEESRLRLGKAGIGFPGPETDAPFGPDFFERLFADAVRLAQERNVPLYCGEYGVIDRAAPEDLLRWYAAIHPVFEKYGIGRAAWSYREMDFGIADGRLDPFRDRLLPLL